MRDMYSITMVMYYVVILSMSPQHNGSCPLHLAAARGHTEVVKVLLEAGASTTEEDLVRPLNLNNSTQYINTIQMPKQHFSTI